MGTYTTSDQLLRVATDRIDRLHREAQQRRLAGTLAPGASEAAAIPSRRRSIPTPLRWSRRALARVGR